MEQILLYVDEGASPRCVKMTMKALRQENLDLYFGILRVDSEYLANESWESKTALLIMPGGRDIPYNEKLKGATTKRIRAFVEDGGRYLGICAGAYFGCADIEFEKGYPLEATGKRELAFFSGKAKGSAYGDGLFSYEDDSGARVAELTWVDEEIELREKVIGTYFNGGCTFCNVEEHPNTTVLARYHDIDNHPPAIIECQIGEGLAILSGVHPEFVSKDYTTQDPYLKELLPLLQHHDSLRKELFHQLLHRLISSKLTLTL